MEYVFRILSLQDLLKERSLFLLGPRQTGKSSYINHQLKDSISAFYSLLDQSLLIRLLADPSLIRKEIEARNLSKCIIAIDEIQKCPALLNEIHLLIEEREIRFLLTGSSARSLKAKGTNLLGGRARTRKMAPFVYPEIKDKKISLEKFFMRGLLPPHFLSENPEEDIASYVETYLKEEIAAEGLTRNLPGFSRFLETAATCNTQILNYTNIASDAQLSRQTVTQWYQILIDTLLGFEVPVFKKTVKRKAIETSKFYFFDIAPVRFLRKIRSVNEKSSEFGEFFEHYICMELKAWIAYRHPLYSLSYWRTSTGIEVDFILNENIAIEVKSTSLVQKKHLKGLKALQEENLMRHHILVCTEERPLLIDGIQVLPWRYFLEKLWTEEFN